MNEGEKALTYEDAKQLCKKDRCASSAPTVDADWRWTLEQEGRVMSMISAQIDELRELAGDGSMEWATGPIRASVLRDAADTIWQLRDDLQRANAENAKLRELAARAYKTARMMCEAWDGPCQSNSDVPSWRVPCPTDERDEQCVFGQLDHDMRELGVEVE